MTETTKPRTPFGARITGTGSHFPKKVVTNKDLEKMVETNDEWIRERTGIVERRIADSNDPSEHNSSLGLEAAKKALEMAGKNAEDIDQIIYATCSGDTPIPSTACWLQKKLGAKNAWAVDINAACSGFVYGVSIAEQFVRSGTSKTTLVIGAEVLNGMVNWEDRQTCILFADGAGAAVIEQTSNDSPHGILSSHMHSDGNLWDMIHIRGNGSAMPVTPEIIEKKLDRMEMKGREIFKVAVRTLSDFAVRALEANGMTADDVDWVVPHQANLRIIEAVAKRLGMSMDKFIVNIDRYANTSAATVPTALDEAVRDGRIKEGDVVLLDVFGAGLTYGSVLMRW